MSSLDSDLPLELTHHQQVDASGTDGAPELEDAHRSGKIWFKDGSVVLLAEKTMFRVHTGVLSLHSQFFRDMFEAPQPEGNEARVEGCPVVNMDPDRAEDWECMLIFIYHSMSFAQPDKELSFAFLAALMRLGRKYQFDWIRDYALARLKRDMPKTTSASVIMSTSIGKLSQITDCINLALELKIQSILPVFYFLCVTRYTTHQIFDGVTGEGQDDISRFSPETQRVLIIGREKMQEAVVTHCMEWLYNPQSPPRSPSTCVLPNECPEVRLKLIEKYSTLVGVERFKWIDPATKVSCLCGICSYGASFQSRAAWPAFWQVVPSFFDLPKWEDLRDFEE